MKISVDRKLAYDRIGALAIMKRGFRPAFGCVRLAATESDFIASSCDGELSTSQAIFAATMKPGVCACDSERLRGILNAIPDEEVVIALEKDDVVVSSESFRLSLPAFAVADLPPMPSRSFDAVAALPFEDFGRLVRQVKFAAADELGRYCMNVAVVEIHAGRLVLWATDGRRLSEAAAACKSDKSFEDKPLVHKKHWDAVLKVVAGDGDVRIAFTDSQVTFAGPTGMIVCPRIESTAIDTSAGKPKQWETTVTLPRQELLAATKAMLLYMDEQSSAMLISPSKNALKISRSGMLGGKGEVTVPASVVGAMFKIELSAVYVREFLETLKDVELTLRFTGQANSVLFSGANEDDYRHYVARVCTGVSSE